MTRYHILVSDELMAQPDLQWPEGFRVIEPSGPGDGYTRWWLVEDDNAPAGLEQHRVEPVFIRVDVTPIEQPPGSHYLNVITERHIVDEHGRRVAGPVMTR